MFIAITDRYEQKEDRELFCISKKFKDIFDKLNVTLIPVMQCNNIDKIADMCSCLILTGSAIHVNPKLYNAENEIGYIAPYNDEDKLDYLLIKAFLERKKPILGICRGIQVLNVYFGGNLTQSVANHEGVTHNVRIGEDSFLAKIYGSSTLVNSTHTQCLKNVALNFKVTAISDDGVIEGIEDKNIIGVQWHPEYLTDINFFERFIEEYVKNER